MPEVYLKPLKHKSMAELNGKLSTVGKLVQTKAPAMLLKTALQMPLLAEKNENEGDEEEAYVLFMRFVHLVMEAKNLPEYKKNQLQILFNNAKLKSCMDRAEVLNKSLERRYKSLAEEKSLQNAAFDMVKQPRMVTSTPHNGFAGANEVKKNVEYTDEVKSKDLYELINRFRGNQGLLIMDTRPEADYLESHIDAPCIMSVPESIIKIGITANKVEAQLPADSKNQWQNRKIAEYVVLLDWRSSLRTSPQMTPVHNLKNILLKWDVGVGYKRDPLILSGGYADWLYCYPYLTTNFKVTPKHSPDFSDELISLDDIEYPDFLSSPPEHQPLINRGLKPLPFPNVKEAFVDNTKLEPEQVVPQIEKDTGPKIPVIDRSSKQKAVEKMKQEQEAVLTKALRSQEDLLEAERKWDEWRHSKEEEASKEAQELKEGQFLDEIQRLEDRCKKLDLENAELKTKIQNESDVVNLPQTNERKDEEFDKIKALTSQMAKKRLTLDPQNKPANEPPSNQRPHGVVDRNNKVTPKFEALKKEPSELSNLSRSHSSPNIKDMDDDTPQFDRSIKPMPKPKNPDSYVQRIQNRDLSPVFGTKGRGLTGLKNLGNSCYMNSIVQCISNTLELADYFCKGAYRQDVNTGTRTRGQIVEELAAVIRALWAGEYRTVACRDFKRVAGAYHGDFGGVRQQDSHEFLTLLMDWLHDDLNRKHHMKQRRNIPEPEGPPVQIQNIEESADTAWRDFEKCNDSRILHLFYGQQSSTVTCNTCGFYSVTFEPFSTLSLVLPQNSDKCSLNECLDLYLAPESIQEWRCPKCKNSRRATKKFDIWRLPPILVIHFKRFCEDIAWRKQHTLVEFPIQRLMMSPFTLRPGQRHNNYNLYAVSNHYGTMDGGHYTTYSHSREFKKWYKFDDAEVSEISESSVRSNAAYILFYASVNLSSSSFIHRDR